MSASNTSCSASGWERARRVVASSGLGVLGLGVLGLGALACGLSPGDYVVYRVATSSTTRSVGCYYPATEVPDDVAQDVDTVFDSLTLTVHLGLDGKAYLSGGTFALEGDESGDGYSFVGQTVNIEYIGPEDDAKITTTTTITVNMVTSGDAVDGTVETVTTAACDYVTATPSDTTLCPSPPVPTCNEVNRFVGVEIDDVELTTDVD